MRIAFLGLGGVGGYFGAKLARTYDGSDSIEISFLCRERTAAAIRERGIRLITPGQEFVTHPHRVITRCDGQATFDFLIVAVKGYDLAASLNQFRACIGPGTVILPLLNGVDAPHIIRRMFPANPVLEGCVYIVSRITSPGVITETGNIHQLHFGGRDSNRCTELFELIRSAHDDTFLHDNINGVIWEKFVFISSIASLTSFLDKKIGQIFQSEQDLGLLKALIGEVVEVAKAEGVELRADIVSGTLDKMSRLPFDTTSSMHSDFKAGNQTEIDSLTGHVIQLAHAHRISCPVYEKIYVALHN